MNFIQILIMFSFRNYSVYDLSRFIDFLLKSALTANLQMYVPGYLGNMALFLKHLASPTPVTNIFKPAQEGALF